MNKAVEALDRIDETIGLIRGCLNDPPELVAMNVESMKADFDGMLKDLRTYGAYWRGQALQPSLEAIIAKIEAEKVEEKGYTDNFTQRDVECFFMGCESGKNNALNKAISIIKEEWGK